MCRPTLFPAEDDLVALNRGDGQFVELCGEAGLDIPDGRGFGLVVADFNEDSRLDVFVANDQMALGAYTAITEAGLSIPDDIAVVGYDDDALAPAAAPALTTMRQSMTEMGAAMAGKLVDVIEGRQVERATILKTRLIVRGSS